jgi:hypothetical protein
VFFISCSRHRICSHILLTDSQPASLRSVHILLAWIKILITNFISVIKLGDKAVMYEKPGCYSRCNKWQGVRH